MCIFIFVRENLHACGTSFTHAMHNAERASAAVEGAAELNPDHPDVTIFRATFDAYKEARRQNDGTVGRAVYDPAFGGYAMRY